VNVVIGCGLQKSYFSKTGSKYLGDRVDVLKIRLEGFLKSVDPSTTAMYLIREVHQPNDKFYLNSKTHAIVGTEDIEVPEIFKAYFKFVINTTRPGAFYKTPLDSEISKLKPQTVYIIGVETHTNVLFTAEEFRNRDYPVTVYEALVTAEDDYQHALGISLLSNTLSVQVV